MIVKPMNLYEVKVFVFVNASPLTSEGPAHGGHILPLVNNAEGNATPMGWVFRKLKRKCTRQPLHAETFAVIDAEAHGQSVKAIVEEALRRKLQLHILTDSKSLIDNIISAKPMKNKKLNMDMALLRNDFDGGDFELHHIVKEAQIADVLNKHSRSTSQTQEILWNFVSEGRLS